MKGEVEAEELDLVRQLGQEWTLVVVELTRPLVAAGEVVAALV